MISKATIDDFLAQKSLAIVGVSRSRKKFGSIVYRDLKSKGYEVLGINPGLSEFDDDPCYPDLSNLPGPVGGAVLVVPPVECEKVVREAKEAGISRIWMQQGAESSEAVDYCKQNDMTVVHGFCIMMFTEGTGLIHRLHRGLWKVLGKLPR